MTDWRTTKGAAMTPNERAWLRQATWAMVQRRRPVVVVHIGVEYGASLWCTAVDGVQVTGVDLDCSKFLGDREQFRLLEGPSNRWAREFYAPIDLLFVDGDHTREGVRADMAEWLGKVRPGGIVAFHDYGNEYEWTRGVREAVDAWHWADTTWDRIGAPDSILAFARKPYLRRGEGFGTIGIGVPYFKPVYDFWRWWSWLLVGGLQPGDQFLNTMDVPGEVPIPMAHNALVVEFLRTDRDTLCIVEDDHVGEQDVIHRMREKPENWDFDIVCANYPDRRGGVQLMGVNIAPDVPLNEYGEITCEIRPYDIDETGTQAYDIAALGCVFIRRWVLVAMYEQQGGQHPNDTFWFDWHGRNSQDVVFYHRARQVGARTGIDRDARLGHIGHKIYTCEEHYERLRAAREKLKQEA